MLLRALRRAAVDGRMREERICLWVADVDAVNPSTGAMLVNPQEFPNPPPVALDVRRAELRTLQAASY